MTRNGLRATTLASEWVPGGGGGRRGLVYDTFTAIALTTALSGDAFYFYRRRKDYFPKFCWGVRERGTVYWIYASKRQKIKLAK